MSKKIRRYSVLALFSICVVLLLSLLILHTTDPAFAADYYRTFTVSTASSTGNEAYPHVATDNNDYVYITYEEGSSSIDFIKSMNKGASFSSAVNVGTGEGFFPRIAIDNVEKAYVIYNFQASTNYYPRAFKSDATYAFTMKLEGDDYSPNYQGASSISQDDIELETILGTVKAYAVSEDDDTASGWHIYFWSSTDGAETWNYYDLDTPGGVADPISTLAGARYPTLAVNKETVNVNDVHVAWVHQNDFIMYDYSDNGGGAWQGADVRISDVGSIPDDQRPGLAVTEISAVTWAFAVWTDVRNVNRDVYFSYANDTDGLSNWKTDVKLGLSSYESLSQEQPSVAVKQDGTNHVYAVWRDTRDGPHHIYFQEAIYQSGAFVWGIDKNADGSIDDTISTEVGEDMRVSSGSNSEDTPTVVVSPNGEVYVVWNEAGTGIKCASYDAAASGEPPAEAGTPDAPTNLSATGSNGQVALSWTASTSGDVISYNIYRSTTRGSWPGTATYTTSGTTYTDSSVTNGICYWYVVTAVDVTALESGYSDDAHGTPSAADTTAPDAPTALAGTGGYQKVDLSWTASTAGDVSSYHVYSSTATGGPYSYVNAVTAPATTYSDTSLVGGTTYYYVVTAVDASGNESVDSTEANAAPTGTLDTPTGLSALGRDRRIELSWTAPATGSIYDYKIYRGSHAGGPYTYLATVGGSTTSYSNTGLTNGTKYYYVVTAVFDSATGPESGDSDPASATANPVAGAPAAPTNLTAAAGDAQVTLAWEHTELHDFDHYNIYRSTTRGSWGSAVATTTAKTYTISGTNGTTYWFVVTAVDEEATPNESAKSNDANATPNPTDTTAPDVPTNLQASGGDTMVALTWSPVSASKYHVYRSVASGVNFYKVGEVNPDNWFFDGGLSNGMTYYYVVTALDSLGNESGDSNEAIGVPRGGVGTGMGIAPGAPPALPEEGGGGGCFIATACYGSPLAGEVRILSRFRDNCLLTNASGRAFVKGYYRLSPPIAGFIAEKPLLKFLVRIQLKPWVKIIKAITN